MVSLYHASFGGADGDGHLGHQPWSLLWHGWLPLLSGTKGALPWTETAVQGAGNLLEQALGSCSSTLIFDSGLPRGFDSDHAGLQVSEQPDVWTDGSLVLDEVSGASSSGSGFYSHLLGVSWSSRRKGQFDELGLVGCVGGSCGGFLRAWSSSDCSESRVLGSYSRLPSRSFGS